MASEVQLLSTCLIEQFYPAVPEAVAKVLELLNVTVKPIRRSFCCGQAPFNEGMRDEAMVLARRLLESCKPGVPVIVPSGSCAGMIRNFYGDLLADNSVLAARAAALRPWVYEFSQFMVRVLKVRYVGARFDRKVAYHPSCHSLRELQIDGEPLSLLSAVKDIRLCEIADRIECCGFGGMFSVKFPHISAAMLEEKLDRVVASGAEVVTAVDCGCLMQIGGGLHRRGSRIETMHLAEILAAR
jgi:L-lactate dehydrogenase complex protein LldE